MAEFKGLGPEAILAGRGNAAEDASRRQLEEKFKNWPPLLKAVLVATLRHRSGF